MESKPASAAIRAAHRKLSEALPFSDRADFVDADRGFIAALDPGVVGASDGRVVWDNDSYAFLSGEAPPSVNPSLWRQSTLVAKQGLYGWLRAFTRCAGWIFRTSRSSRATRE